MSETRQAEAQRMFGSYNNSRQKEPMIVSFFRWTFWILWVLIPTIFFTLMLLAKLKTISVPFSLDSFSSYSISFMLLSSTLMMLGVFFGTDGNSITERFFVSWILPSIMSVFSVIFILN